MDTGRQGDDGVAGETLAGGVTHAISPIGSARWPRPAISRPSMLPKTRSSATPIRYHHDLARLLLPNIKVLYMSGYPRDAVFRDRMLDTGTHLLSKPFSKAALAEIVRQVLDERTET